MRVEPQFTLNKSLVRLRCSPCGQLSSARFNLCGAVARHSAGRHPAGRHSRSQASDTELMYGIYDMPVLQEQKRVKQKSVKQCIFEAPLTYSILRFFTLLKDPHIPIPQIPPPKLIASCTRGTQISTAHAHLTSPLKAFSRRKYCLLAEATDVYHPTYLTC